jgi:arylsulfatase A-like enzyme
VTDVITDLGIEFIRTRPSGRPFFLMLHHKAPHRPWEPAADQAARFKDRWIPEPETFWDSYQTRSDALRENRQRIAADLTPGDLKVQPSGDLDGDALTRWKYQRYMHDYLATVQSVDDGVGRVLEFLDRTGLTKNTIVIYTSDQGFFLGDHGLFDKRFMYEESLRMPFLVRWPAAIKPGTRSDAMALNVDFAPTFLTAAGLTAPADIQGVSLLPVLTGRTPAGWRTSMYYRYYHDPGDHNTRAHYGVRTQTHKLIHFWKIDQWELFDLKNDSFELHNLYGQPGQDQLTATLKAELTRLQRAVRDEHQLANEQLPNGVDGPVAKLRGK